MAFQEKSAWIMSLALLLGGLFYFGVVAWMSSQIGELAPPILPLVAVYTVILIIIAIVGHVVIAVFAPKDANTALDERERQIFDRAGHLSGYVVGVGVLLSLGLYLFSYSGNLLFYGVFASLMISQLAEYAIQIFLYRSGV
ncbi:MAG: hypothetical protein MJE77_08825 [Proteobacteria bacterium]|nr:hypothetical protein [Pseudomonadota bacterium]